MEIKVYDDKETEVQDKAITLLICVRKALERGTKHYRKSDDCLLETDVEIIEALVEEGELIFEPAPNSKEKGGE